MRDSRARPRSRGSGTLAGWRRVLAPGRGGWDAVLAMSSASVRSWVWRVSGVLAVAALVVVFAGSVQARQPIRSGPQRPAGTASVTLGCADATEGQESPGWLGTSNATVFGGPVAWPELRNFASHVPQSSYKARHGLVQGVKALIAVSLGHVVRVVIPTVERSRLSMDYTFIPTRAVLDGYGYFRVSDGASQVTFRSCSPGSYHDPQTAFAGAFLVAGTQCARIDIYVGSSSTPLRRQIPFGVPERSCPTTG